MKIEKLVETTCLIHSWPTEIKYEQGLKRFSHEFINTLMEAEYGIKAKLYSSGNLQTNYTIEIIHQVFGDLVRTYNPKEAYVDDYDLWVGILYAA